MLGSKNRILDPGRKQFQVAVAAGAVGQLRNAEDDPNVRGERGWAGEAAAGGESLAASEWNDVMYLQNEHNCL